MARESTDVAHETTFARPLRESRARPERLELVARLLKTNLAATNVTECKVLYSKELKHWQKVAKTTSAASESSAPETGSGALTLVR